MAFKAQVGKVYKLLNTVSFKNLELRMDYSNYVDINSAIPAGFDYHENQVRFNFGKMDHGEKDFLIFLRDG